MEEKEFVHNPRYKTRGIYHHFEGESYLLIDTAINNDTGEREVVYLALYDIFNSMFVRTRSSLRNWIRSSILTPSRNIVLNYWMLVILTTMSSRSSRLISINTLAYYSMINSKRRGKV